MRYYIIAGEASGDLHGSNLIRELLKRDPQAEIRCWGGDKMQSAGATLVKHFKDLAFMGFLEVISNLKTIMRNFAFCKKDIATFQPDAIIFIDYPGFNLRMAKWAKLNGYKTIYYISPQVWAWKENRTKDIKSYVDKMMVILPFESTFYQKWNYPVDYVGHPLVQVIDDFRNSNSHPIQTDQRKIIALLPGSRRQEILTKLPIMLAAAKHFPAYRFILAKAPSMDESLYQHFTELFPGLEEVTGKTYELLNVAHAALVTSGTATLEAALFKVPQVICYKGNPISYQIAKRLVKIKFIGLANLIMDKEVVKELIQDDLTEAQLVHELKTIVEDGAKRLQIMKDYDTLHELLSKRGNASSRAAQIIHEFMILSTTSQ